MSITVIDAEDIVYSIEEKTFNSYIVTRHNSLSRFSTFYNGYFYNDQFNNVEDIKHSYNYYIISKTYNKILLTISSEYYSENFLKGLTEYFTPLFNTADYDEIETIINNLENTNVYFSKSILLTSEYNHGRTTIKADDFIKNNADKSFTQAMIAEFLIYYSYFYDFKNIENIVQAYLNSKDKYNFTSKKHIFSKKYVNKHKVYSIFNPILYFLTEDEIDYCYKINEMNITRDNSIDNFMNTVEQVKINYKVYLIHLYKLHDNSSYKDVLIKDLNETVKKDLNNNFSEYLRRIENCSIRFTVDDSNYHTNDLLEDFINNITIDEYFKIKDLSYNYKKEDFEKEEYFVDYLNNIIKDENITQSLKQTNEIINILHKVDSLFSKYLKDMINRHEISYSLGIFDSKIALIILFINYIKELNYSTGITEQSVHELYCIYSNFSQASTVNPYFVYYLQKHFSNSEIINILTELIKMDLTTVKYTDMMKFIDNYAEYEDVPVSWALQLVAQ